MKLSKVQKTILVLGELIIIALIIYPYLRAAWFANFAADDINALYNYRERSVDNIFAYIFSRIKNSRLTWQGTYNAWGGFLTPVFLKYGAVAYHFEYTCIILIWTVTVSLFINAMCQKNFAGVNSWIVSLGITIIFIILVLFNCSDVSQAFYWHSGASVHNVPFLMGVLSITLIIRWNNRIIPTILSGILAFLSAGGSLCISAFICSSTLILTAYRMFLEKRYWKNSFIVFGIAFVGSLINACAPGNFVRFKSVDPERSLEPSNAVFECFKYVFVTNKSILLSAIASTLIIGVFFVFVILKQKDIHYINPFVLFVVTLFAETIVCFPFFMANARVPARLAFVFRCIYVFYLILFYINLLGWVSSRFELDYQLKNKEYAVLIAIGLAVILIPYFSVPVQDSYYPFKIYHDLSSGELDKYEKSTNMIINQLENAEPGSDVYIEVYDYGSAEYLMSLGITKDSTDWVNRGFARFYNVNSVVVIYKGNG